jgi:hypothetical protein
MIRALKTNWMAPGLCMARYDFSARPVAKRKEVRVELKIRENVGWAEPLGELSRAVLGPRCLKLSRAVKTNWMAQEFVYG